MLLKVCTILLGLASCSAADVSGTAYLAGRNYSDHPDKQEAIYAGAYAAFDSEMVKLEGEVDHSIISGSADIEQYDVTLVLSNGTLWESGQLRAGVHLISSTDAWTDAVYGGILSTAWRVNGNFRIGSDIYATHYANWDEGLTVLQASPWVHWSVVYDDGWWMADRLTINGIYIDGTDLYSQERSTDFSINNSFHLGRGAWALALTTRIGHFRFGHEQSGFVINNSPDDLEVSLATAVSWYPRH